MVGILARILCATVGLLVIAIGGALVWFGAKLIALGGDWYFALAGAALVVSGALIALKRRSGYWLYLATTIATLVWAVADIGLDRWGLVARLLAPAVLLIGLTALAPLLRPDAKTPFTSLKPRFIAAAALQFIALAGVWWSLSDHSPSAQRALAPYAAITQPANWESNAGDDQSDRFSPLMQITTENVGALERVWTYRIGGLDDLGSNSRFTATPLAVNGVLYLCSPRDVVVAVDAQTGREIWRHDPQVDTSKTFSVVCRGVSYYRGAGEGACASRILLGTLDARMIALDAATGARCEDFGVHGAVDLTPGVQPAFDGYYAVTSPPTIIGDTALVGGYVVDNQSVDVPHSVVRAYDVRTGALRWAWDPGADLGEPRQDGLYAAGNPNAWTIFSADPALGLVFVPTGNSSPDFYGALRTRAAERYATALVALDAATGAVRWSFQAVHHDLWDYDMPAPPALTDIASENGQSIPALVVTTKTGQIFLLDRRSGEPIAPVEERPVPASSAEGERASPTQPFSSMPSFAPHDLRERDMWGATPIDMALCRIRYRSMHYEGAYTAPSVQEFLFSPGAFGALNWGGVAIDRTRHLMIVNSSSMPFTGALVPREEADRLGAAPLGRGHAPGAGARGRTRAPLAMEGTPYGLRMAPFLSPIGFPCHAPPWGEIAAIDLRTRAIVWRQPFGSSEGMAPFGVNWRMGLFNLGGAVATAGGVTFIGAATDSYFRAYETSTGAEIWRDKLPAGGQASPISFTAPDGRQMVAIVAGGHGSMRTPRGDYLVAYALPRSAMQGNPP